MAVPEHTGYPLRWFKQQDSVRNLYECAICHGVVKDAVQIRDCGHQFCHYCLDDVLRSNVHPHCPVCKIRISNEVVSKDNDAIRAIGNFDVNCPDNGCEWVGTLNSLLQEHTGMCQFLLLHCSNVGCDEQVTRRDLEAHLTGCEYRIVICQYCNSEHVFKDEGKHLEVCFFLPVGCVNGCPQTIPRNQMLEHLETVCIKTVVKCKYSDFGCEYQCERQELEEHLNQEMRHHLELSTLEISRLKVKNEKEIKQKSAQYDKDKKEMKQKNEKDIQEIKQKCAEYAKDKGEMKQEVNTVSHLMIIRDFNKKLLEAKDSNSNGEIDGESFYSSPDGYKMKLTVQLNETRQEYKDHMGVYLTIMKSDRDAILSWPFKKKYTFTLFDQQDDEKERENIVHTVTPRSENHFKRPELDENLGQGHPDFVSHKTLQTRKYVKDNTVFIKFSMET